MSQGLTPGPSACIDIPTRRVHFISDREPTVSALKDNEKPALRIGVYRIEEEIGAGAMGKVYRATHETLGKAVALKIVHADDPTGEVAARFLQEGIAASRVRHPNVVEILDAGKHDETAFMAMQLLEGETMAECLSRQGRLPQTYAVDLILPVCAALAAAHDAGVLHRDLKPANIFLSNVGRGDPEPILLDFGISKILGPVDPELTQNPRFLGSPLYLAPEQADGAPGSPRSDQYSLALTLYEALLGVRPFSKYSSSLIQLLRHVAEGNIRHPRELDASIPDDLDAAIRRALSTNPRDRFPTVREFGAALLPFASQARRTLWQQSFVDAERTMTSANAPISGSTRSSRRVQVSVDAIPPTDPNALDIPSPDDTNPDEGQSDFLTHSSLFGSADAESLASGFERSSVSRRDSQAPSSTWDEQNRSTDPSLDRTPLDTEKNTGVPSRGLVLTLAVLFFGLALLIAFRPFEERPETFVVEIDVEPKQARILIDGRPVGKGHFRSEYPIDGKTHHARFELEGHEPQTVVFQDHPPVRSITLSALELPARTPPQKDVKRADTAPAPDTPREEPPAPKDASSPERPHRPVTQSAKKPTTTEPTAEVGSDPNQDEVSTKAKEAPPTEPARAAPPDEKGSSRPSLHTGNLDPWAK